MHGWGWVSPVSHTFTPTPSHCSAVQLCYCSLWRCVCRRSYKKLKTTGVVESGRERGKKRLEGDFKKKARGLRVSWSGRSFDHRLRVLSIYAERFKFWCAPKYTNTFILTTCFVIQIEDGLHNNSNESPAILRFILCGTGYSWIPSWNNFYFQMSPLMSRHPKTTISSFGSILFFWRTVIFTVLHRGEGCGVPHRQCWYCSMPCRQRPCHAPPAIVIDVLRCNHKT